MNNFEENLTLNIILKLKHFRTFFSQLSLVFCPFFQMSFLEHSHNFCKKVPPKIQLLYLDLRQDIMQAYGYIPQMLVTVGSLLSCTIEYHIRKQKKNVVSHQKAEIDKHATLKRINVCRGKGICIQRKYVKPI